MSNKVQFFKPKDFESISGFSSREDIAVIANAKLQQLIDANLVVYGKSNNETWWSPEETGPDSRKARLMFIEQLEKPECKHEPRINYNDVTQYCKHCGIELVATWKAKD